MKLNELRTGDMVIMRNAVLGLTLVKESEIYMMYQDVAWHEDLRSKRPYPKLEYADVRDFVAEDLKDAAGGSDYDIMQVLRNEHGMIDFETFEEGELIYERDRTWKRPPVKFLEKVEWNRFKTNVVALAEKAEDGDIIYMLHHYPSAFSLLVTRNLEKVFDYCFLDSDVILKEMGVGVSAYDIKAHLEHVLIPGTEDLYIAYSTFFKERERDYRREDILVNIPELNLELCIPCIVYKKDKNGTYKSLTKEDSMILFKYFIVRDCLL